MKLELGLSLPVAVGLSDHLAFDVVGPEDGLLELDFSQSLKRHESQTKLFQRGCSLVL